MKHFFYGMTLLLILSSCNAAKDPVKAEDSSEVHRDQTNSVLAAGIPHCDSLTPDSFAALFALRYAEMLNRDSFPVIDAIQIIRINNTFIYEDMGPNVVSNKDKLAFGNLIWDKHLDYITRTLECSIGHGGAIYTPKYDLFIGFSNTQARCQDYYIVLKPKMNESR